MATQDIKTFNAKAKLDHKVTERGDTQTVHVTAEDQNSDQPIAGAFVEARVTYPGGELVKSIGSLTDEPGRTSISIPGGSGTEFDTVDIEVYVSLTGFNTAVLELDYAIVSEDTDDNDD